MKKARKNISFRKYKKELNRKHSPANARLYQSFRKEEQRIVRARRKKAAKSNPPKTRKGKTGTWIKAKAVKVTRVKGKLVVQVKR